MGGVAVKRSRESLGRHEMRGVTQELCSADLGSQRLKCRGRLSSVVAGTQPNFRCLRSATAQRLLWWLAWIGRCRRRGCASAGSRTTTSLIPSNSPPPLLVSVHVFVECFLLQQGRVHCPLCRLFSKGRTTSSSQCIALCVHRHCSNIWIQWTTEPVQMHRRRCISSQEVGQDTAWRERHGMQGGGTGTELQPTGTIQCPSLSQPMA